METVKLPAKQVEILFCQQLDELGNALLLVLLEQALELKNQRYEVEFAKYAV
ncbi:MAG: hypothetical protein KME06_22235 [Kastovskya adunca ATA6-11-RM4]|jgi:hypothetical protein|nr:hypothetical protein [Kastovskya adunca ATA6-11-RM4]